MTNYHILPRNRGWAIKKEGGRKASKVVARQDDAIKVASRMGENVFIHDKRGLIRKVTKDSGQVPIRRINSKERVHVLPYNDKWAVKSENKSRANKIFDDKFSAIRLAHEIADNRGTSMVVHKENGEISHIDIPPHFQSPMADLLHLR